MINRATTSPGPSAFIIHWTLGGACLEIMKKRERKRRIQEQSIIIKRVEKEAASFSLFSSRAAQ